MLRNSGKFSTKRQIQAQIQQNIQELSNHYPKQGNCSRDHLDDSLTSLQWLWNLNVNINPPIDSRQCCDVNGKEKASLRIAHQRPVLQKNASCSKLCAPKSPSQNTNFNCTPFFAPKEELYFNNQHNLNDFNLCTSSKSNQPLLKRQTVSYPTQLLACAANKKKACCVNSNTVLSAEHIVEDDAKLPIESCIGPLLSDAAKPYTFSSSSNMRKDIYKGTVDYKTNALVKPPFTFISLIYMALQKSKRSRMTSSSICKWIKDNFIYYRYADDLCQISVEEILEKSKCFSKVQRKKKQPCNTSFWQINPSEITTQCQKESIQSLDASQPHDVEHAKQSMFLTISGRKRKQQSPQKVINCKKNVKACNCQKVVDMQKKSKKNLLQEQAPELGSLKGDYNWNSVFADVFGLNEEQIPTPTSTAIKRTTGVISSNPLTNLEVVPGPILSTNPIVQNKGVEDLNNENKFVCSNASQENALDNTIMWEESDNDGILFENCGTDYTTLNLEQIDGEKQVDNLLIDVGDIDLTITGRQIEPPPEWVPVSGDIDAILCEKQDDNFLKPEPELKSLYNDPLFENLIGSLLTEKIHSNVNQSHDLQLEPSSSFSVGLSTHKLLRENSTQNFKSKWRGLKF